MYVREKTINGYTYLYLVESVREDGRTKQRIITNLGRNEQVLENGDLERFINSVGRYRLSKKTAQNRPLTVQDQHNILKINSYSNAHSRRRKPESWVVQLV